MPIPRSAPLSRGLPPKRRVPVRKMRFQPGSGQKPGLPGLDSDASVPCLFPRERRTDRHRSGAHERAVLQGSGAEDGGLLRHPTLLLAPPGRSGLILSVGQKVVCTSPPKPTRSICWKSCRLSTVATDGRSPRPSILTPDGVRRRRRAMRTGSRRFSLGLVLLTCRSSPGCSGPW